MAWPLVKMLLHMTGLVLENLHRVSQTRTHMQRGGRKLKSLGSIYTDHNEQKGK